MSGGLVERNMRNIQHKRIIVHFGPHTLTFGGSHVVFRWDHAKLDKKTHLNFED